MVCELLYYGNPDKHRISPIYKVLTLLLTQPQPHCFAKISSRIAAQMYWVVDARQQHRRLGNVASASASERNTLLPQSDAPEWGSVPWAVPLE